MDLVRLHDNTFAQLQGKARNIRRWGGQGDVREGVEGEPIPHKNIQFYFIKISHWRALFKLDPGNWVSMSGVHKAGYIFVCVCVLSLHNTCWGNMATYRPYTGNIVSPIPAALYYLPSSSQSKSPIISSSGLSLKGSCNPSLKPHSYCSIECTPCWGKGGGRRDSTR